MLGQQTRSAVAVWLENTCLHELASSTLYEYHFIGVDGLKQRSASPGRSLSRSGERIFSPTATSSLESSHYMPTSLSRIINSSPRIRKPEVA